jgi:hypothetical protein
MKKCLWYYQKVLQSVAVDGQVFDSFEMFFIVPFLGSHYQSCSYSFICRFCIIFQVIVRKDGRIQLLCKGADNVIFERLSSKCHDLKELTSSHLNVSNKDESKCGHTL